MANGTISMSSDFVVEQGTQTLNSSVVWTYRKWKSGVCEAWTTIVTARTSSSGNVHYNNYNYPSFFNTVTCLNINASTDSNVDSYVKYCRADTSNKTLDFYGYRSSTQNVSSQFAVHLMGTWA